MGANSDNIRKLSRWYGDVAEHYDLAREVVARKLGLDTWKRLVELTPWKTGRARASWNISQIEPSAHVPKEGTYGIPPDPDVTFIDGQSTVFVTSNLVYMPALDEGHSKKAPVGMTVIAIAELEARLEVDLQ